MKKYFLLIFVTLFFISCTSKTPYTNRSQMILMSESEELSLGEQSYDETLKNSKVIKNSFDAKRVKLIGEKIAAVSKK